MDSPPFRVPHERDARFVGRAAELAELHEHLQRREIVVLRPARECGGCGPGVTALAVEYAHRHRADHPGGIIWATRETHRGPCFTFASREHFAPLGAPATASSLLTSWSTLTRALAPDALLIVDAGAPSASIASFAAMKCRLVLLTDLHDLTLPSPTIDVGPLDDEAASAYLLPFTHGDRDKAAALARALAKLPLALQLAAGHLATHPDLLVGDYLARLPEVTPATTCGAVLEAVFQSAWNAIDGTAAGALLQTISALTPGAWSPPRRLALLAGGRRAEDGASAPFDAALAQLQALGFTAQRSDESVSVHPGLGALARATVADLPSLCRARAAELLAALSDPGCLAHETLTRGTKSVTDDLLAAKALLDPAPYLCEIESGLSHLVDWLGSTTRPDQDRPPTRARFLQQILAADDPAEPELPALRARAAALLDAEVEPHLRLRRPLDRLAQRGFGSSRDQALSAAIAGDGASALSANREGAVAVWDAQRAEVTRTVTCTSEGIARVGLAADGLICATAKQSKGSVVIWDLTSGQSFHEIPILDDAQVWQLAITPDGRTVVATTNGEDVTAVDLRDPERPRRRKPSTSRRHGSPEDRGAFVSANGQRIAWPRRGDWRSEHPDELWVWDLARDTEQTLTLDPRARPQEDPSMRRRRRRGERAHGAMSADGRKVFTVSPWERLVLWDLDDPGPPRYGVDPLGEVLDLACTADGAFVFVLSRIEADTDSFSAHEWTRLSLQIREGSSGALVSELLRPSRNSEACLGLAPDGRAMVLVDDGPCFIDWINPRSPAAG